MVSIIGEQNLVDYIRSSVDELIDLFINDYFEENI